MPKQTGDEYDSDIAEAYGLINRIVDVDLREDSRDTVDMLVRRIKREGRLGQDSAEVEERRKLRVLLPQLRLYVSMGS